MQYEGDSSPCGPSPATTSRPDGVPEAAAQLAELRAAWAADNQAALDELARDLGAATTPTEMLGAQARFLRATARGFSRQVSDLADLLRLASERINQPHADGHDE